MLAFLPVSQAFAQDAAQALAAQQQLQREQVQDELSLRLQMSRELAQPGLSAAERRALEARRLQEIQAQQLLHDQQLRALRQDEARNPGAAQRELRRREAREQRQQQELEFQRERMRRQHP